MSGKNCYIVSYDIMDQKRLRRVHKTLKGFGEGIHYSVFRCDLTPKGRVEMIVALTELIKHNEDRVMVIDLGPAESSMERRIEFMGVHPEKVNERALIV